MSIDGDFASREEADEAARDTMVRIEKGITKGEIDRRFFVPLICRVGGYDAVLFDSAQASNNDAAARIVAALTTAYGAQKIGHSDLFAALNAAQSNRNPVSADPAIAHADRRAGDGVALALRLNYDPRDIAHPDNRNAVVANFEATHRRVMETFGIPDDFKFPFEVSVH